MSSSSPEYSIGEFVRQLQKSNVPVSQWIATSLDELYLHDEGSLARVKGPEDMNLKYTPRALRVIGLREEKYIGLGVVLSDARRPELLELGRKLRAEVAALHNTGPIDSLTARVVTDTLLEQRKQTVAVLEISTSVAERVEVVQVLYPKFLRTLVRNMFGSIGIGLDELSEREMAFGIAVKYLKSVPFQASEARLLIPENLE